MKISSIYLDLQQAEKKKKNGKDVRKLESEAFKDPLNLQVVFDEDEKKYFDKKIEEQNRILKEMEEVLDGMRKEREVFEQYKIRVEQEINEKDKKIIELQKENESKQNKITQLSSEIEIIKQAILSQNEEISDITEKISQISSSLKRKPTLIKETIFLSWVGESMLYPVKLKDGKYTLIFMGNIKEKNEYCTNRNSFIQVDEIHVKKGEWLQPFNVTATSKLDNPTLTLNYTLFFIPQ